MDAVKTSDRQDDIESLWAVALIVFSQLILPVLWFVFVGRRGG